MNKAMLTPPDMGTVLRISGAIEIVEDMAIRKQLYAATPWLKKIGNQPYRHFGRMR